MKANSKPSTNTDEKRSKKPKKKQPSDRSFMKDDGILKKKNTTIKNEQKVTNNSHWSSLNNSSMLRTTTKKLKSVLKKQNIKGNKSMAQELWIHSGSKLPNPKHNMTGVQKVLHGLSHPNSKPATQCSCSRKNPAMCKRCENPQTNMSKLNKSTFKNSKR